MSQIAYFWTSRTSRHVAASLPWLVSPRVVALLKQHSVR